MKFRRPAICILCPCKNAGGAARGPAAGLFSRTCRVLRLTDGVLKQRKKDSLERQVQHMAHVTKDDVVFFIVDGKEILKLGPSCMSKNHQGGLQVTSVILKKKEFIYKFIHQFIYQFIYQFIFSSSKYLLYAKYKSGVLCGERWEFVYKLSMNIYIYEFKKNEIACCPQIEYFAPALVAVEHSCVG